MSDDAIVLIGAGSTVFTPGLLNDLAASRAFDDFTVRLVDLKPEAAETMTKLGRRIAQRWNSGMRVEAYTDRREALPGAKFVTTTIAVGSAELWRRDLEVPLKYGIEQTVGDSVGPGGVLRAMRHVPELVRIAEDIADLAPDAWLANYTNPLTANIRGITKTTGVKAIGLCHGTRHTRVALAGDLGVDTDSIHTVFAGLNHLCWLLDIRADGKDLYPRLRELAAERAGGIDAPPTHGEGVKSPVSTDLMKTYGYWPAPADRHVAEFFADYLKHSESGQLAWGLQAAQEETLGYIGEKDTQWEYLRAQADGSVEVADPRKQEGEGFIEIATALLHGRDRVELAINMPNNGKISNLPSYAVVELPAVVGAAGITGLGVGALPPAIAAVLTARAEQIEITVDAALKGDRQLALQALMLDPLVPSSAVARAILDEALPVEEAAPQPETEDSV